jgi:hypothetical protein
MPAAHKLACPSVNSRFYLLARCSGRISGQSHSWRHRDIAGFCPKNLTLVPIVPIILAEPLAGLAVAIGFTFFYGPAGVLSESRSDCPRRSSK